MSQFKIFPIRTVPKTIFDSGCFSYVKKNISSKEITLEMAYAFTVKNDSRIYIAYKSDDSSSALSYFIVEDSNFAIGNNEAYDCIFPNTNEQYRKIINQLEVIYTVGLEKLDDITVLSKENIAQLSTCLFHTEHEWRR